MGGIAGKAALATLPEGVEVDSVHFGSVLHFPLVPHSTNSIGGDAEEYCTLTLRVRTWRDTLVISVDSASPFRR